MALSKLTKAGHTQVTF